MTKKIKNENIFLISKGENYQQHIIVLPLDEERTNKFNQGEQIEVTQQELNDIGNHRWLISEAKKDVQ